MTQEEKFKEAQRLYETANADQRYVLESLFPELKESEDERIRKEMIEIIKNEAHEFPASVIAYKSNSWIAWLEKQGEQKPQRMVSAEAKEAMYNKPAWSEEDEDILNTIINHFKVDIECTDEDDTVRWLKSLRPQTTWKPSEEQMSALNYVVNLMASSERPTENDLYYNILKSLRQQLMKLKG